MGILRIGALGRILTPRGFFIAAVVGLGIATFLGYRSWLDTSAECVRCHSDPGRLKELKAPWAYATNETVRRESRHPHIQCRDCHLGDGRAKDKEGAHKGMLGMLIVSDEGKLLGRETGYPYGLGRTGDDRLLAFLPKIRRKGVSGPLGEWTALPVRNILWHDRDPVTFDFDPRITEKTCGRSDCHPEELKQFTTSSMGRNHRQRIMRTWLDPYGPHNCGPSFADQLPSEAQKKTGFDYSNTRKIREETGVPLTEKQARDKQKFCNVCHTGCLDCHYMPGGTDGKAGVHAFSKTPPAESCAGFGRGSSICHPGAMHSRRGETYIGGDFSIPQGMKPDVHYKKGLSCIACHPTGEGGMGHMERKASCQDCHLEIENAHAGDVHRRMDCATCHVRQLGGYQLTAWGPGRVAGTENPFNKYSLYYGIQSPPLLVRDQKGVWMPVKVWPHSVNMKAEAPPAKGMQFRWPDGQTRDAYYVAGTFKAQDSSQLLWLEIEQASHPYGPARDCVSCHASSRQEVASHWTFLDDQGAEPFTGEYRIVADEKGLRITGLRATSPIRLFPGYKLIDFAPWLYLKDKWAMPGDFSIRTDREKYRRLLRVSEAVKEKIRALDAGSGAFDKKMKQKYMEIRGVALHNPEEGLKMLESLRNNPR